MFRLVGFAAVATAIYVSCYRPSFRDCEISCTAESGCPSGLTCDTGVGRCASHGTCAPDDATDRDGSSACSWSYTPANYAPCEPGFPPATQEYPGTPIDTDSTDCRYGSANVCLYHYTKISIMAPLAVTGTRPLILVADGDIDVMAAVSYNRVGKANTSCNAQMATASGTRGAGGGGGGYGSNGGAGGGGNGVNPPLGGGSFGSPSLEPLMLGCPGADSGSGGAALSVKGGMGGGAIELSSNATVTVANGAFVSADGGGGSGGAGVGSDSSGGGGGGAGGSILIEGSMVAVAGMLCAVGGGGAQGGFSSNGVNGASGMGCTAGAGGSSGVGAGGQGGGMGIATSGQGGGSAIAGGGGGGGVGRIRIHSSNPPATTGSTVPMAVVE